MVFVFRSHSTSRSFGLPDFRGSGLGWVFSLFVDSPAAGYVWFLKYLPYLVVAVGLVIACWGFALSIVSGDPLAFARSGAQITLLGFVIGFLSSSYAEGVYQAERSVDPKDADVRRLDIIRHAESRSTKWTVLIIIPGTLIWGYGDLISKRVEKYACDHKCRLAVHCTIPPPPLSSQTLLVLFDWNRATVDSAGEEVILDAARDAKKDSNAVVHLVGRADTSGSPKYNLTLSECRANAVNAELSKLGVKAVVVSFAGSSDPIVSSGNNSREALNRNVEILIEHGSTSTRGP
jgi:outer membrane protein OmpA-like peptidoglycan-associated protein